MRVIVTRPLREAREWVAQLSAAGLDALALPLIQIDPVPDPTAVQQAWQRLADYAAVMFVSANAVEQFFAARPASTAGFAVQTTPRAWATGPGTQRALLRAGVAAERIDSPPAHAGQFDSEALWQVVAAQLRAGQRVLIVRGADGAASTKPGNAKGNGRDWLATQIAQAGAQADFVVSYQRSAPQWNGAQQEAARQAASDGSVWLFSSSEALANLGRCLPGQSWAAARALATHPRIKAALVKAGFGAVAQTRPTLADVLQSLSAQGESGT